jgi:hypothetical protein
MRYCSGLNNGGLCMFGKSIHKKLAEDFSFVKDYGFQYLRDSQHDYVGPSIYFGLDNYTLEIGYDYDKCKMFVLLYDSSKKIYPNKASNCTISQCKNIIEGIALNGRAYKDQVEQVKRIIQDYLDKERLL